jgi:hypothetical protein
MEAKEKKAPAFGLIWRPDGERPNPPDFASAMNASTTLEGEKLASTTAAIEYAAKAAHPEKKVPWIKAHFATAPREFLILSPKDIKDAAARGVKHWTEIS